MTDVRFYPADAQIDLTFVVIGAVSDGRWVWCRHRDRDTWEMPGGHIEPGEDPLTAAARELREETGAVRFALEPVCIYSVLREGAESAGLLCRAEIDAFGPLEHEIAELRLTRELPESWTYPAIQPHLLERLQ